MISIFALVFNMRLLMLSFLGVGCVKQQTLLSSKSGNPFRKPIFLDQMTFHSLTTCLKLFQFQSLQSLIAQKNSLSSIPASLVSITTLTSLDLSYNKFASVPPEVLTTSLALFSQPSLFPSFSLFVDHGHNIPSSKK
jgi:Leucine-rich repeat (LRR) protein